MGHSKSGGERDDKVLNSLLFVCECVAAGEPSNCPASNISTKLIKLCQDKFITECLLVFLFREKYYTSCFITVVQSCDEYIFELCLHSDLYIVSQRVVI